ncbi:MAG TPA: hypothetical protein VLF18_00065 [Tahibacter sp.]|uniref:hypothetical protein n=1 Tax=Tahibacter sp. TaxID=2056211 RepID=UPI002C844B84|nr:hypothetical protein [Tahibacter sp.]HSX58565.1 hypothetical protein [Tahibacter sp.]
MTIKTILKFVAPLLLVAACEGLFRLGAWEPMVKPESHAGTSLRLKRALTDPALAKLDLVTIGSSRPVYGIDHEALAALAQEHGVVHANLSMPGSHWMTVDVLTDWLAAHRAPLRGGILATDLTTFKFPGNGSYELAIAVPFRRFADDATIAAHVPFDLDELGTWGTHSALYQYREDIRDFVRAPRDRRKSLRWWNENFSAADTVLRNPSETRTMCDFGVDRVAACDAVDAATGPAADGLRHQCRELRAELAARLDFSAVNGPTPLPDFLHQTRDNIRNRLRALNWKQPPVIVLMPLTGAWKEASPKGLHAWALSVLQPLVDEGRIRVIDATDALADAPGGGCGYYFDFFHQNDAGRAALMARILPQLREALYGETAGNAALVSTPAARGATN